MPSCAIKWCAKCTSTSSHTKDGITFHRFPNDDSEIRDIWIKATHRDNFFPTKYSVVCSRHFTPECFEALKNNRRRLYKSSVPTLYLPTLTLPDDSKHLQVQSPILRDIYKNTRNVDAKAEDEDYDCRDLPSVEIPVEVELNEYNDDVCKVEIGEHTLKDSDRVGFVPATTDNLPEVNMFAVVQYISKNEKALKLLDYPKLKLFTKNNPSLITSIKVLQTESTYRVRGTVNFDRMTSHMCEIEYDTHTDTITSSECVCGSNPCEHTAAFVMFLSHKPTNKRTESIQVNKSRECDSPSLKESQTSDGLTKEVKVNGSSDVGPSSSTRKAEKTSKTNEVAQPSTKRQRVDRKPEVPVVPEPEIKVVPLPKDEHEPGISKIQCIFPRKTIYTQWNNTTGSCPERCKQIKTTLNKQLQDDDYITDFSPLQQRIEHLCDLFDKTKGEGDNSKFKEFLDITEVIELDRMSRKVRIGIL